MYFMRYSSLSLWVGELWFYHQGFGYCIFKPCVFLGHIICTIYTVSRFAQPKTFLHLHIALYSSATYVNRDMLHLFLLSLRCSFLSEKEKNPLDNALLYSRWMIKSFFRPLWNRRSDVLVRIFREIFAHGCRWFIMA